MQERLSGHTRSKWAAVAAAFALTLGFSALAVQSATADSSLPVYDENDSPNPLDATNGLVFYKAADLGWTVNSTTGVPISGVTELSYTVASGTDYAPSIQLITHSDAFNYARLVWEPYLQDPAQGPNTGTFSNVQTGLWWTNKIPSGPGSQAEPKPLAFFDGAWANLTVRQIAIHQGSTTESTSLVTNVSYNGDSIPLGDADNTPFDQSDIDSAVDAYAGTHHRVDNAGIGTSRASVASTPVHGQSVGVKREGTLGKAAGIRYQWYLSGTAVSGATNSTYKVPSSAKGKSLSVRVTGRYNYVAFGVQSSAKTIK